jgi:arachidonate 15-lipoxygenase (second type) / 8-lipoxygenase (S-type)
MFDFPTSITNTQALSDIISHFAQLGAIVHGSINSNQPAHSQTLPLHPAAFYSPLPTSKGVENLLAFLPTLTQSIGQISLTGFFNRPFTEKNGTGIVDMFNDKTFLGRTNLLVQAAELVFRSEMTALSDEIQSRRFDQNGLSQVKRFSSLIN